MMTEMTIDGSCYHRMLLGGAQKLAEHKEELNALNVFPVADGDTGTNMLRTMEGGLTQVNPDTEVPVGDISNSFAKGILLGARGNSGVILSQLFAGINQELAGLESVTAQDLARAYLQGITKSYAAVQNPTEGTILTVFRESAQYAAEHIDENSTVSDFFRLHIEQARRSLEATKELLSVLAEADVVDSGGAGYVYIAEGMYEALCGKKVEFNVTAQKEQPLDIDQFTRDSVLEFGYCTEFLIRLTNAKVDPDTLEIQSVLADLEALEGESIVAYKQDDIVKVHVHTFHPGQVMERLHRYGEFLTVKVENMSLGHSQSEKSAPAPAPAPTKPFCLVAVAAGDGISALFTQMGVDQIVSGGQTANPSIEEFVEAFRRCPSENIIVLPNNKNILLAAQQAAKLYTDAKVHVVETKNLMQGYSALSVITPGLKDIDALLASANRAARSVTGGEITAAVRDAVIDGVSIRQGQYMGICDGSIRVASETAEDAVTDLLDTVDMDLSEIITLFVGKNVSDDRRVALTEALEDRYPDCEIVVYEGGQDVYDYYLAVE